MSRRFGLLVLGLLVIPLVMIFLAYIPSGYRFVQDTTDVQIDISLDRRWVIDFGQCVTLRWDIVGAREVYLNDNGRVGNDQQEVCVTPETQLQLFRIVYPNASDEIVSIRIGTFLQAPEIWVLVLLEISLFIILSYAILAHINKLSVVQKVLNIVVGMLVLTIIVGVFIEIGLRWYFGSNGTDADKARYLYSVEELQTRSNLNAIPFLNYGSEGREGNLGFRQTHPLEIPKPDGVYRIVTLGGSTTYGIGMEASNTYPAELEKTLQTSGYRVEVINAGIIGYNTWNSVVMLAFRALELEPDLIIVYDSVNDVGPRVLAPECYRGETYFRGIQPNAGVLQLESLNLPQSALVRFVGVNLGWLPDPVKLESNIRAVIDCASEKPVQTRDELIDINPPTYFQRNLISLIGIANIHQVDIMFSTWTYNRDCSDDVCPTWWKKAINQHNDVIRQVAQDYGAYLFDLATTDLANQPENWFGDFTHQSEIGAEAQSQLYAEYIIDQIFTEKP